MKIEDIVEYPLILPPRDSGLNYRKELDKLFVRKGLVYRVIMESSNVELSSLYSEMGLGISFASIVQELPVMKKRKLAFIPLKQYFKPNYLGIVTRKNTILPFYKKAFINMLIPDIAK
ncbi:LysR substrate binding domain-containing protein [Desulfallas thermosapovorans DSM 6562]|uniref:LysR substrate binding domain-containing protein n=1 Tax=Desulfallas thermosapovorans DSM 6562 TaxID=1121431 RepID=A0A5S4ZRM9_9FIRM|nr:LysR substrate binding domain-containing protein [Desulfallas thermosapovorans DSM 6562]